MREKHFEMRKSLLFAKSAAAFRTAADEVVQELRSTGNGVLAGELYLDLSSYLIRWKLLEYVQKGELAQEEIEQAAATLLRLANSINPAGAKALDTEAQAIADSNVKSLAQQSEEDGPLATHWGHDFCLGLTHSMRRGASFLTTNPAKINAFRKAYPQEWEAFHAEIKEKEPNIGMDKLLSWMYAKVAAINARELLPVFEATGGKYGFICAQVSPRSLNDSQKMEAEILFWERIFRKELGVTLPNVVYKLPAVSASQSVADSICKKGLRVCMTLDFTYTQHDTFAKIIQKSPIDEGFVVLMCGFLDDAVAPELEAAGVPDAKLVSRYAAQAVIRKSYANLRKNYTKVAIMGAAIRGDWTIQSCISEDKKAPMYFTTVTDKILEFDSAPRILKSIAEDPIPAETLTLLEKSDIFRKAYYPELLKMEDLEDYIPLQNVLSLFLREYAEMEESLR